MLRARNHINKLKEVGIDEEFRPCVRTPAEVFERAEGVELKKAGTDEPPFVGVCKLPVVRFARLKSPAVRRAKKDSRDTLRVLGKAAPLAREDTAPTARPDGRAPARGFFARGVGFLCTLSDTYLNYFPHVSCSCFACRNAGPIIVTSPAPWVMIKS